MITGVKVFSATMVADRERLSDRVNEWIAARPKGFELRDIVITQSSDDAFHCIAITVFYFEPHKPSVEHFIAPPSKSGAKPTSTTIRLQFKRGD